MNQTYRMAFFYVFIFCIIGMLAGCGKNDADSPNTQAQNGHESPSEYKGGPAELIVYDYSIGLTDAQFESFFVEPVKAKYPEISLVRTTESIDKQIAAGTFPDIVLVSNVSLIKMMEDYAIPDDLTQMIKTYNIDLGQIEPAAVAQVKKIGDQKTFNGLPISINYGATIFNKDIFDKFGVAYPKEVMTFEEALEIAKKLTRTEGGTNYKGFLPTDLRQMFWQYGVPVYDKAAKKAILTTDAHAKVLSLVQQFYSIPGFIEGTNFRYNPDLFFKEQRLAMYPLWINAINLYFERAGTKDAFKWDLAASPTFSDRPGLGRELDFHMASVSTTSKNKEAAYMVLKTLLSKEVQLKISKAGRVSALLDDEIRNAFGEDSGLFNGKNLQAIFKVKPSPLPESSKFDPQINAIVNADVSRDVMVNGIDINTALRKGEEKANKEIDGIGQ